MRPLALACILAAAATAQLRIPLPGQRPTGGSPPTQAPGPAPRGSTRTTTTREEIQRPPETTFGNLRRLTRKELVFESADHRVIFYRVGDDLRLDEDDFRPGDHLVVESVSDEEGRYTATFVENREPGTPEEREAAEQPVEQSPQRPEPPELKDDSIIAAARQAAAEFLESLPSFQVKRNTTRYAQLSARGKWEPQDVVTSTLAYKDGREAYTDVKISNKSVSKDMQEIDGLRSTGEFGEILADIFDPFTAAAFSQPTRTQERGRSAWKYKFEVPRERSVWRIMSPSQHYFPAYGGAVFIDQQTNRVLRLEMQARALPKAFPFDTVEMSLDYDYVRLDAAKQFLLPTEAEALNCIRGTSVCMRNSTSFRNYVKFNAESGIVFEDIK